MKGDRLYTVIDPRASRAKPWAKKTALIHASFLFLYPTTICGCHFSVLGLLWGIPPIGWGFYLLLTYETWHERIVAYVAVALSFAWIWIEWTTNVIYFWRR